MDIEDRLSFLNLESGYDLGRLSQSEILRNDLFLVNRFQVNAYGQTSFLPISEKLLKALNAREVGGELIEGFGFAEIEYILKRIVGTDNQKIYELCRNAFKAVGSVQPESIQLSFFRGLDDNNPQTEKQWFKAVLQILKDYTSTTHDPKFGHLDTLLDNALINNKGESVFENDKFTDGIKFTKDDLKLAKQVWNILERLFGSYTVSKMVTGNIFAKDGVVRFTTYTWESFHGVLKKINLYLRHKSAPHNFLPTHEARGTVGNVYSYLLDSMIMDKLLTLPADPSIDTESRQIKIQGAPLDQFSPYFKNPENLDNAQYQLFSEVISSDHLDAFEEWLVDNPHTTRKKGSFKLYDILKEIYYKNIDYGKEEQIDSGISREQAKLWRTLGLQSIHHNIYGLDFKKDHPRWVVYDFLTTQGRGQSEYVISFKPSTLALVNQLKDGKFDEFYTISLTADDYHLFEPYAADILASLDPLSVRGLEEYKYDKILETQKEQIEQIVTYLKKLAKEYGKIIIYPFKTFSNGFGYRRAETGSIKISPFFPQAWDNDLTTMPGNEKYYILDSNTEFGEFQDDFVYFLGGLLLDNHMFIIKTESMNENEMITAFSLLDGALSPSEIIPSSDRHNIRPPLIKHHNTDKFKEINKLISDFVNSHNMIGYQRSKTLDDQFIIWKIAFEVVSYLKFLI